MKTTIPGQRGMVVITYTPNTYGKNLSIFATPDDSCTR